MQVLPRPPLAEALLVERIVIADQPASDTADAEGCQLVGPAVQHRDRLHLSSIQARIAAAANNQVTPHCAVHDGPRCGKRGPEGVVPPQALRGGGERRNLHVRRRHHQPVGVVPEQHIVPIEGANVDGYETVLHRRGGEDAGQIRLQGADVALACVDDRGACERIAQAGSAGGRTNENGGKARRRPRWLRRD